MVPGLSLEHIVILGIIALIVVGPKDLPLLLRKMGQWTAKLRGMAQEFRSGFDELARQAELDELKKEVDALRRTTNLSDIQKQLARPLGTLESYAGVSPPLPPSVTTPIVSPDVEAAPNAAPASSSMEETPRNGGDEPAKAPSSLPSTSPQSSLRDDNAPIEGERIEPAPLASSAP